MFSQPPDETKASKNQNNPRRRRKKKFTNKLNNIKKESKRKQSRFAVMMSSWAENFTVAATWQLKHQVAYWKSKAMALEYENKILHDIIEKNCDKVDTTTNKANCNDSLKCESEDSDEYVAGDKDDEDFEVSEEYIQFLTENAKYKEDARQERERLKAKMEKENDDMELLEAGPSNVKVNTEQLNKDLYGQNWQRISALETSLQSTFINECDMLNPMLWPNIPFNFN